jgi:hypothetical protein
MRAWLFMLPCCLSAATITGGGAVVENSGDWMAPTSMTLSVQGEGFNLTLFDYFATFNGLGQVQKIGESTSLYGSSWDAQAHIEMQGLTVDGVTWSGVEFTTPAFIASESLTVQPFTLTWRGKIADYPDEFSLSAFGTVTAEYTPDYDPEYLRPMRGSYKIEGGNFLIGDQPVQRFAALRFASTEAPESSAFWLTATGILLLLWRRPKLPFSVLRPAAR